MIGSRVKEKERDSWSNNSWNKRFFQGQIICNVGLSLALEGRTLTRESNSEHTASLKTSNIPFAWFLKE